MNKGIWVINRYGKVVWSWLGSHTTSISSLTSIVQAVAVLIGVYIAVDEFVVKDRSAQQNKLNNSYDLRKRFEDLPIKAHEFSLVTSEWIRGSSEENLNIKKRYYELQNFLLGAYIDIYACLSADQCDQVLTESLFCETAKITSEDIRVAYYSNGYVVDTTDAILPTRPLFEFVTGCNPNVTNDTSGAVPDWWKSYSEWREQVRRHDTLRIHGPIQLESYSANDGN